MEKKFFFFDIDGTLTDRSNGKIVPSAREALEKLRRAGHFVAINTGRAHYKARMFFDENGFDNMVCNGGKGIVIDGVSTGEEIDLPSAPRRIECTQSVPFTIPFSYVDINGHMNNAHYFDLAEDCIPAAAGGEALKSIKIEYVSEARCGESFTVFWGESGGTYFITGEGERPVFRMALSYS